MKKLLLIMILFCSIPNSWGAVDESFDYMNIPSEKLADIHFKKTTFAEMKAKVPSFKTSKLDDGQTILVKKTDQKYSEIRIGFNENKLEWIEFILKNKASLNDFLSRYGEPDDINENYHPVYNYYNYGFFNVSVNKQAQYIYSITLFDTPHIPDDLKDLDAKLPNLNALSQIFLFSPKTYSEEDFGDNYDSLYPQFNEDGSKTYTIKNNIISKYEKAEFVFKDGLLKNLILYPDNLSFEKIKQNYGNPLMTEENNENITKYNYKKFSIITNKHNQVLKIILI